MTCLALDFVCGWVGYKANNRKMMIRFFALKGGYDEVEIAKEDSLHIRQTVLEERERERDFS